ncbi:alpha/beta-hydrolase [Tothia fuscella]|uniref:Alpha/beta-hydrolase n=1 Tax=Tothia fuscella TaxID=1048955 RepID=A0A9P4NMR1_9PEZI|nr:alpha/beta-hydrolase [Tothia fuscella]
MANYARVSYASINTVLAGQCDCKLPSDFKKVASGGGGLLGLPRWYVGYVASNSAVIVAHAGTDDTGLLAALTDTDFFLTPLGSNSFPGVPSNVEVHDGFLDAHKQTASAILAAVKSAITMYSPTNIYTIGHGDGGALALLDSIFLPLQIQTPLALSTFTYGMPRVGNQAFANYVDAHSTQFRITNRRDPIPITPGKFLGFTHSQGEIHVQDNGDWVSCPGQDNTDELCTIGDVPNIFAANINNHIGPYGDVRMSCSCR